MSEAGLNALNETRSHLHRLRIVDLDEERHEESLLCDIADSVFLSVLAALCTVVYQTILIPLLVHFSLLYFEHSFPRFFRCFFSLSSNRSPDFR